MDADAGADRRPQPDPDDGSAPRAQRAGHWVRQGRDRHAALLPRRSDWAHARPGRDLTAGLMVGLVALPLALGFGVSSGMGAGAGLVTAIVAGVLAAVFGGSRVQVSGPTGAMTVVLVPIVAAHGADGVLVVGLLAGLILVGLGYAGAGRFIRYVPVPVVEGFTLGIAAIIALQQVPAALGVPGEGEQVLVQAGSSDPDLAGGPGLGVPARWRSTVVRDDPGAGPGAAAAGPGRCSRSSWRPPLNAGLGLGRRHHRAHPGRAAGAAPARPSPGPTSTPWSCRRSRSPRSRPSRASSRRRCPTR